MARPAKPWYRKDRDAWYVMQHGKQIMLAKGKANGAAAHRKFLEITERHNEEATSRASGDSLCSMFLEHAEIHLKPKTVRGYRMFLEPFAKTVEGMDGNSVMPKHVTSFLNAHVNWNKTTRYNAITAIKRAWAWAHAEGHTTLNQLRPMRRPRPERRDTIPDDNDLKAFVAAANPAFRQLLIFMRETGCRPGEATMMQKHHVDLANKEVRFKIGEDKTSGKTGRPRVIHLNDTALAMLRSLIALHPSGPLFRNSRGKPWTEFSINCAARKAREKAGLLDNLAVAYAMRLQYITDALARGVPIALVAEMTGTSPEMIARVYSHVSEKKTLLMDAVNQVRPS